MIPCAVSIPETNLDEWLETVADTARIRHIELPAVRLRAPDNAMAWAEQLGLRLLHARELLPANLAPYVAEQPLRDREDLRNCLQQALEQCRDAGGAYASLDVGLDRMPDAAAADGLTARVRLLRALLPVAEHGRVTLGVQVRVPPPFPGSRAWHHAANLVHEVMHPRCRLTLDLVPAEFDTDFDVAAFVRRCCFTAGLLRFHYRPDLGEEPAPARHRLWAAALVRHGFRGGVVFVPDAPVLAPACLCGHADRCAAAYLEQA